MFSDTEVIPSLLVNMTDELLLKIIDLYLENIETSPKYITSLDKFLEAIIGSESMLGQICLSVDQFKLLFERVGKPIAAKLLNDQQVRSVDIQVLTCVLR